MTPLVFGVYIESEVMRLSNRAIHSLWILYSHTLSPCLCFPALQCSAFHIEAGWGPVTGFNVSAGCGLELWSWINVSVLLSFLLLGKHKHRCCRFTLDWSSWLQLFSETGGQHQRLIWPPACPSLELRAASWYHEIFRFIQQLYTCIYYVLNWH